MILGEFTSAFQVSKVKSHELGARFMRDRKYKTDFIYYLCERAQTHRLRTSAFFLRMINFKIFYILKFYWKIVTSW